MGALALSANTSGSSNIAIGDSALVNKGSGSFNTVIGNNAGPDLTDGSNNIYIGETAGSGVISESSTIRIGNPAFISTCYIAGISGQTTSGGAAVFIDDSGKLGTLTSSARFKDEIRPMKRASESIFALKPVTFRYKKGIDPQGIPQFGLVAEDVEQVNPALVARDTQGKPYTVRYEAVNAMLLNEFLKEHRKVDEQDGKMAKQGGKIEELEAILAQQRKEINVLTASLKEQAAQIQKVSNQVAGSKVASRIVANDQ